MSQYPNSFEPYIPPNPWDKDFKEIAGAMDFIESPTHALYARILARHLPTLKAVKVAHNRFEFFIRNDGRPYHEEILNFYDLLSSKLENLINQSVEYCQKHNLIENPKEFYSSTGAAVKKARTRDFLSGVISFLSGIVCDPNFTPDITPESYCCIDAVIDFSGSELIARQPREGEYFVIHCEIKANQIINATDTPVKYNVFLWQLFFDDDDIMMARYMISLFIANKPMKFFQIWYRSGNNGKTALSTLIKKVIGEKFITGLPADILMVNGDPGKKRFNIIKLNRRSGGICDESPEGAKLSNATVKSFSSGNGSVITGEKKGQDSITFLMTAVIALLTNHLPRLYPADDVALVDRLLILVFNSVFCKSGEEPQKLQEGYEEGRIHLAQDGDAIISEIVESERTAILRMMMTDFITLRDDMNMKVPISETSKAAKEKYLDGQDDLKRFFLENLTADPEGFVSNSQLSELWAASGFSSKVTVRKIKDRLTEKYHFIEYGRCKSARGLSGIKLLDDSTLGVGEEWQEITSGVTK